jgi:hypothetical protein
MAYLVDNNVAEILAENGRDLVAHVPIVGAEAMLETIQGFDDIARNLGGQARDMDHLLTKKMTFDEAIKQPGFPADGKAAAQADPAQDFRSARCSSLRDNAMPEFSIDIGKITYEVARRHHIRLADDDPTLASVTLTEHVPKVFTEHLKKLVEGVADQVFHL